MTETGTTVVVQTPVQVTTPEGLSLPEVALEDCLVKPEDALTVVEHEVEREELCTFLQGRDLFAKLPSQDSDGPSTLVASNVFDPEKFKGIDLRGVDASAIRFLNNKGDQVSIADFILGLQPEEAKDFFQGTVYDEGTKFSTDEGKDSEGLTKNERVHKLLESISSEYKGGSELTDIQALVEPAETRFRRLLGPSEAGSRSNEVEVALNTPRVVGVPDSWSSLQQEVQSNKSTEGGKQGADSEEIVASGEEKPSNSTIMEQSNPDTSATNHSTAVVQHDDELAEELRKFIKLSAQERVGKIKKLVEPEECGVDESVKIVANQRAIELVKGWLREELRSNPLGVIFQEFIKIGESIVVQNRANPLPENNILTDLNSLMHGVGELEPLSHLFEIEMVADGKHAITPDVASLKNGMINKQSLDRFYEVNIGELGTFYGITELAEIDINTDGQTFIVKSKGKLFLPNNHPYFTENPTPSS